MTFLGCSWSPRSSSIGVVVVWSPFHFTVNSFLPHSFSTRGNLPLVDRTKEGTIVLHASWTLNYSSRSFFYGHAAGNFLMGSEFELREIKEGLKQHRRHPHAEWSSIHLLYYVRKLSFSLCPRKKRIKDGAKKKPRVWFSEALKGCKFRAVRQGRTS